MSAAARTHTRTSTPTASALHSAQRDFEQTLKLEVLESMECPDHAILKNSLDRYQDSQLASVR